MVFHHSSIISLPAVFPYEKSNLSCRVKAGKISKGLQLSLDLIKHLLYCIDVEEKAEVK